MTKTFEQLERERDRIDTGNKIVDIHLRSLFDEIIAIRWAMINGRTVEDVERNDQ
jgi:hypothetical protein